MELGSTIRKLRKERKMTAKSVAQRAGISFNALSAIEKNRSFPTQVNLYKICQAMGIPLYLVLMECVTIDDIPPKKRVIFQLIWPPIMEFMRK